MKGFKFSIAVFIVVSVAALGVLSSVRPAYAPPFIRAHPITNTGDSTYTVKRSATPIVMTIEVSDVTYAFDGEPLEIPFTLKGAGGETVLAVYTDWGQELGGAETLYEGGRNNVVLRLAGLDTMISVTSRQKFPEGSHTIRWTGLDYHGNPVPAGDYTYYVISYDVETDPTWIGYGNAEYIDPRTDPPLQYWGGSTLNSVTWGTDLLQNPEAVTTYDLSGGFPEGVGTSNFHLSPEFNEEFFTTAGGENLGVYKAKFTPGRTGAEPVLEWGADGYVHGDCGVMGNAHSTYQAWHPYDWPKSDDGMVWMALSGRGCVPNKAEMWPIDRQTGEVGDIVDVTDYFTILRDWHFAGEDQTKIYEYTGGPGQQDVAPAGLHLTGHNSAVVALYRRSDGAVIYNNLNGDGWVDHYTAEGHKGIEYHYDCRIGRYNFSYVVGGVATWQGTLVGPDGQGIMLFDRPLMPWGRNNMMLFMDHEYYPEFAGIYWQGGMSEDHRAAFGAVTNPLLHIPFDLRRAKLSSGVTYVEEVEGIGTPEAYALGQNYPNPFNPETTIRFAIPERGASSVTTVKVYNAAGQLVNTLVNEILGAGEYETVWDGTDRSGKLVSSGLYFYTMKSGAFMTSKKMTLLK